MAIGLTVTKSFVEKCRSLCKLMGKSMHAKVKAVLGTEWKIERRGERGMPKEGEDKNQLDALIHFAYILVGI